jgi:ATP-dependent Clp endopeptidase proteolytic subunit ClpP
MDETEQVEVEVDSEERIVRLTGEITEESADKCIRALHELCQEPGEITMVICSDGGSLDDGFRIIDAMAIARTKECPVNTVVSGKASSMGAIIFCAGVHRTVYRHARIMIHPAYYTDDAGGTTSRNDAMNMALELDYFNGLFRKLLSNMSIPPELLDRMLHEDVYVGADDAIQYGIAHEFETEII